MSGLFLDASYAIALAAPTDRNHARARELASKIKEEATPLTTTWPVLLEIGNSLARARYRAAGVRLINAILTDPSIEIVPVSESLHVQAFGLYKSRPDKEWGLTDCLSFVVMKSRRLMAALTTDRHFRQAGFEALLLNED